MSSWSPRVAATDPERGCVGEWVDGWRPRRPPPGPCVSPSPVLMLAHAFVADKSDLLSGKKGGRRRSRRRGWCGES